MSNVKISGLSFAFPGSPPIFDRINLNLNPGLTGIVGPNGTGKSTLLRLISSQMYPTCGVISHSGVLVFHQQQDPPSEDPRSGGEWMRAQLETFLSQAAGIFLLDEPSHHLDTNGRAWLFHCLIKMSLSDKVILVASHDGELLQLCSSFVHLHPPSVSLHGGPYSIFLTQLSAHRNRLEQAKCRKDQRKNPSKANRKNHFRKCAL